MTKGIGRRLLRDAVEIDLHIERERAGHPFIHSDHETYRRTLARIFLPQFVASRRRCSPLIDMVKTTDFSC